MIYTICDIETTGFNIDYNDILSFGFIRMDSQFNIVAADEIYFYKESFDLNNKGAYEVHQLTENFLKQHVDSFKDNIKTLYTIMNQSTIIGKNSTKFDLPFIASFLRRYASTVEPIKFGSSIDLQILTKPIYQQITGSKKVGKLHEYAEALKITDDIINKTQEDINKINPNAKPYKRYHSALFDCNVTYNVFKKTCEINKLNL